MSACRVWGCTEKINARLYGWNAAKEGEPPRNVKARLCIAHARELRKTTKIIALEKRAR